MQAQMRDKPESHPYGRLELPTNRADCGYWMTRSTDACQVKSECQVTRGQGLSLVLFVFVLWNAAYLFG